MTGLRVHVRPEQLAGSSTGPSHRLLTAGAGHEPLDTPATRARIVRATRMPGQAGRPRGDGPTGCAMGLLAKVFGTGIDAASVPFGPVTALPVGFSEFPRLSRVVVRFAYTPHPRHADDVAAVQRALLRG